MNIAKLKHSLLCHLILLYNKDDSPMKYLFQLQDLQQFEYYLQLLQNWDYEFII